MTQPIPLRPDPSAARSANVASVVRAAIAASISSITNERADRFAAERWPRDSFAALIVMAILDEARALLAGRADREREFESWRAGRDIGWEPFEPDEPEPQAPKVKADDDRHG